MTSYSDSLASTPASTEPVDSSLAGDVCIVGAGPAGLILATQLAAGRYSVVVLESGPPGESAQDLGSGKVGGDPINALNLQLTRHRGIGGNANLWSFKTHRRNNEWDLGVRYGPQTDLALGVRPWIEMPGWPLAADDILRWSRKAHELVGDGDFDHDDTDTHDTDTHRTDTHDAGPETEGGRWTDSNWLDPRYFSFGPRNRYLVDLRTELERSRFVQIIEGATVTHLGQEAPGAPIDHVSYRDRDGRPVSLRVKRVVLACGGVENARLLLASGGDGRGIGDETSNVGRYLMDHPLWAIGDIELSDPTFPRPSASHVDSPCSPASAVAGGLRLHPPAGSVSWRWS